MLKRLISQLTWQWGVAVIYVAMATTLVVCEVNARALLLQAKSQAQQGQVADAILTLERLTLSYPITLSVPPAREAWQRLQSDEDWQQQIGSSRPLQSRMPLEDLHPMRVDWLPLWGWPACSIALLMVCFTRLGKHNRWAGLAIGLAVITVLGTLSIWGWYSFVIGRWFIPVLNLLTPWLQDPGSLYLATWALIAISAAMLLCPMARPVDPSAETKPKSRPDSPNDPRLALEYLNAQRVEQRFTNVEYARRREAILSQI